VPDEEDFEDDRSEFTINTIDDTSRTDINGLPKRPLSEEEVAEPAREVVEVGTPPSKFRRWESAFVDLHDFANLPSGRGNRVDSPTFECLGVGW
jgi:hypothetical protein